MPPNQRYRRFSSIIGLHLFPGLIVFLGMTIFYAGSANADRGHTTVSPPRSFSEDNAGTWCQGVQPHAGEEFISKTLKAQQAEWALGRKLAATAEQNAVMLSDELILRYVNRIEATIVDRSGLPGCFVVKIIVDSEPNAYSLPGGFVYLTTGLIDAVDSEGQLAAALAHETAHITARHLIRFETERRIYGRLALFSSPAGYILRRYLGPLFMFGFVRRQEFQADQLGMRYHVAAGYDSLEFFSLLRKLVPEDEDSETFFERLTDTHPTTKARLKRLTSNALNSEAPQAGYLVNTSDFQEVKTRFVILKNQK